MLCELLKGASNLGQILLELLKSYMHLFKTEARSSDCYLNFPNISPHTHLTLAKVL